VRGLYAASALLSNTIQRTLRADVKPGKASERQNVVVDPPGSLLRAIPRLRGKLPIFLLIVAEHCDAAATDQTKLHAGTLRILDSRRHRCGHGVEDVIVLWKRRWISAADVRDILQPRVGLGIDDAERLNTRDAVGGCDEKSIVAGVVPHFVAAADLCNDIEDVARERAENNWSPARGHQEMLKRPERDSGDASVTDVPPPLGFGPAIPLTRPT